MVMFFVDYSVTVILRNLKFGTAIPYYVCYETVEFDLCGF